MIKESGASAALNREIVDQDAQLNFAAARLGGLKIQRANSTPSQTFSSNPAEWYFPGV